MTEDEKKPKTSEESLEAINKSLYRMNGTLMKEGELGENIVSIAASMNKLTDTLEKCNWNFGAIATALKKLAENSDKMLK